MAGLWFCAGWFVIKLSLLRCLWFGVLGFGGFWWLSLRVTCICFLCSVVIRYLGVGMGSVLVFCLVMRLCVGFASWLGWLSFSLVVWGLLYAAWALSLVVGFRACWRVCLIILGFTFRRFLGSPVMCLLAGIGWWFGIGSGLYFVLIACKCSYNLYI